MIPIVVTVRKQSQRCPNKILRPFDEDRSLSLLDICLAKFRGNLNVYVAGFEKEFQEIAEKYQVSFIQRTKESAESEDPLIIHSHLKDMEFNYICQLNACCPFVTALTVYSAIDTFERLNVKTLFSVKESHELIFTSGGSLVNTDRVFNSKIRKPNYVGNNVIMIYRPDFFFNTGTYWSYVKDDPYLYVMDHSESTDIDTEFDFLVAQATFKK